MRNISKYAPILALSASAAAGCASEFRSQATPDVPTVAVEKVPEDTRKSFRECFDEDEASKAIIDHLTPRIVEYGDMNSLEFMRRFRTDTDFVVALHKDLDSVAQKVSLSEKCLLERRERIAQIAPFLHLGHDMLAWCEGNPNICSVVDED